MMSFMRLSFFVIEPRVFFSIFVSFLIFSYG